MRYFLRAFACLFIVPAHAQPLDEEGFPIEPLGERGRYSQEQGEEFALRVVRGEVLSRDVEREGGHLYYEYSILARDDSIYEVEINAQTGEVYEIEVERLSEHPRYPFQLLDEPVLRSTALSVVEGRSNSIMGVKVVDSQITVFKRKVARRFLLKQGVDEFEVIINARNGRILEERKL